MTQKELDLINTRMQKSANLYNLCLEKQLSGTTMDQITRITKDNTTVERERRYQMIGRITDMLQESKTEEEFLQKLRESFPESF